MAATSGDSSYASIGYTIARVLVGLIFTASGIAGFVFLFVAAPQQPPGLAGQFQDIFFRSHWVQCVDGIELIAGLMLLSNRYVALGVTILGGVLTNILIFHITMLPTTVPIPLIVVALWCVVAYRVRAKLAPLFTR